MVVVVWVVDVEVDVVLCVVEVVVGKPTHKQAERILKGSR